MSIVLSQPALGLLGLFGAVTMSFVGPTQIDAEAPDRGPTVEIRFDGPAGELPARDRQAIAAIIETAVTDVHRIFPVVPSHIAVRVAVIDRDLRVVAGVTGSANTGREVTLILSTAFPGGAIGAAQAGLRRTVFHEVHHLVTGWTLDRIFSENSPHRGQLLQAMVYEGLADVFAVDATGVPVDTALAIPSAAAQWLAEIQSRPAGTPWKWDEWMNRAPDGRLAIGYRIGAYIVRRAMERSGKSIVTLTTLPPAETLRLAEVGS